jgi:hypothetical protein
MIPGLGGSQPPAFAAQDLPFAEVIEFHLRPRVECRIFSWQTYLEGLLCGRHKARPWSVEMARCAPLSSLTQGSLASSIDILGQTILIIGLF